MILDTNLPKAIIDSCVLYKAPLRDLLLNLALPSLQLYIPYWTDYIQEEWVLNLLKNRPDLKRENLDRTLFEMKKSFPGAIITDYDKWINTITLPDPNDYHVLAAAIETRADYIITFNIKDFLSNDLTKYSIKIIHPDDFIISLIDTDFTAVCKAVKQQRSFLKNPAKSAGELLDILQKQGLTRTVSELKTVIDLI